MYCSGKITHSIKGKEYIKKHIPKYEAVTYHYRNKVFKNVNQFLLSHIFEFFSTYNYIELLFWIVNMK